MTDTQSARDRLLDLVSFNDTANRGITPEQAVDDAIHEALLNQPSLRTCLVPGCLRQYDALSCMNGAAPPRPEWSGEGWATLGSGTIFPAGGHLCPDHKQLVTDHLPRRVKLPNDRWTVDCACGWMPAPQTWHGLLRALWEQHLLTTTGQLPTPQPIPDPDVPGTRLPLNQHTEATLTELYDRLWDAEADREETRDTARACILGYTAAVPALLGAKTALEGLRARITVDSRDWSADKLDALLWAVLVGWNCENTEEGHVHDGIDCAGDQGLWDIARQHDIPIGQTIQAGNHRWWVANAIKVAKQIEDTDKSKEG
ncbi:hypothetical protein ACFQ0X_43855 [Streptomyces rectiviolaceus]|uniref:Uncharacterized protein n=1 Tax=Streptomyces rectiviolaceus TaxID=332591 RepID=A0ABP6NN32_9ACTN